MARVLMVSPDRIAPEMAGPGIRYVELGRQLARTHEVALAAPLGSRFVEGAPEVVIYDTERPSTLQAALRSADVLVAPPVAPRLLARRRPPWIVDLYNPELFEGLEHQKTSRRLERKVRDVTRVDRIAFAARSGAAFICSSERQRDMWLGFLAANRRLDSDLYERDPQLRTLIDVVPSGLPASPPELARAAVLRGSVFPADSLIMVWNGGLWDWLDPETVLRALALLREVDPRWTLVFTGTGRPSHRPEMATGNRAEALARDLGLKESGAVHFRPGWTPYAERGGLLVECDVGVCAHRTTLETRFAFRTRILDFLWAGLPVLYTEGDEWGERVRERGLGEVVPPSDPAAFAEGARRIAERGSDHYRDILRAEAKRNTWELAAKPLLGLVEVATGSGRRSAWRGLPFAIRFSAADAARSLRRR